jgi:tRNA(Ile)-lysidine synthase
MSLKTSLLEHLTATMAAWPRPVDRQTPLAVAFSGGIDSTVLLAAIVDLGLTADIRALHVDHGLHGHSPAWRAHCERVAAGLGVAFAGAVVRVETEGNLEASARKARYAALAELMRPGEVLLTAHHADDQLETLLYRLVRGAGVRGMRGILDFDTFGPGFIARPLLAIERSTIEALARELRLAWIEDPANADTRFDRNFLRRDVVPRLKAHWPHAAQSAHRLGCAMRDAEEVLDAMAELDVPARAALDALACEALRALSPARQRNLLRYAIRKLGLGTPDADHLARLGRAIGLDEPHTARVQWPGGEAGVFRDTLYLFAPLGRQAEGSARRLTPALTWHGPAGRLELVPTKGRGLPDAWVQAGLDVRFRTGGEVFQPLGSPRPMPLKKWLHEAEIVPWMRERIPLLVHEGYIVAVADLCFGEALARPTDSGPRWRVEWARHPRVR